MTSLVRTQQDRRLDRRIFCGALVAVIAALPLLRFAPALTVAGVGVAAAIVIVACKPQVAAYALVFLTPLTVGLARGSFLPVIRVNEALILLLGCVLAGRWLVNMLITPSALRLRIAPLDAALLALAVTSSVLPLLWLLARGLPVERDDVLHALILWKYYGVYAVMKASVATARQVRMCLKLALTAAVLVGLVGLLQSVDLFGVADVVAAFYAEEGPDAIVAQRASSTLGSSIAMGDVMALNLAIALGWLVRARGSKALLGGAAVVFVFGAIASGQFSGVIALVLAVAAVGFITGTLGRLLAAAIPTALAGGVALWPVVQRRLKGFSRPEGVPQSWMGRLDNLRRFFWPELADGNFLLGVRPSARVPAPETWRPWVYIESGHTWLLWTGGIPFLLAYGVFTWIGFRTVIPLARERLDEVGVAAVASFAGLVIVTVLMCLDVHLTLRGAADLLFALMGLALGVDRQTSETPPELAQKTPELQTLRWSA